MSYGERALNPANRGGTKRRVGPSPRTSSVNPNTSVQTTKELRKADAAKNKPWTVDELQKVRAAAQALVRTHESIDRPNGTTIAGVDGRAFWDLLGALDRSVM